MEAVHHCEGTVNQVMGDGIIALFDAPLAHEDHPVRAGYAALPMQEAVGRYAEEMQRAHGLPIYIRIGLNSGEWSCGPSEATSTWTTRRWGNPPHLAARMEQGAMPGSILMTAETLRLAEGLPAG